MARKGNISPDQVLKKIGELISNIPEELLKPKEEKKTEKKDTQKVEQSKKTEPETPTKIFSEKNEDGKVLAHGLPMMPKKNEPQKPETQLATFKPQEWNIILQSVRYFAYYVEEKNGLKQAMPVFDLAEKVEKILNEYKK